MTTETTASRERPVHAGRPRSQSTERAIVDAFVELLTTCGFARLRLEHVAKLAGVSKASIYRRWDSKEALALHALREFADVDRPVPDLGDSRAELLAVVSGEAEELTGSRFGPLIRALLCEIAGNPGIGDPFRATVIATRREDVRAVVDRGIRRGDLRPSVDPSIALELLLGPVYFRLVLGGVLDDRFTGRVVDQLLAGYKK